MSELYDKLAKLRDENRASHKKISDEETVFLQLLSIAFMNPTQPDELPEIFKIHNVMLYKDQFKSLMERIGLDVTVEIIHSSYAMGNTFRVVQNN